MNQEDLTKLLIFLFNHQLVMKMYHFQTKCYGAHKASDSYLETFRGNLDKLMEVAQGRFGTVNVEQFKIPVKTTNDSDIDNVLVKFCKELANLDTPFAGMSDLLNIRDEMIADAQQLRYLLRFK